MHLLFFRLMRSLSTLRVTKLELAGKNEIAWRLGSSAPRRLITDLLCGRTTPAVSPPTLFVPRPPTNLFMLNVLFYHTFVIHTSPSIHFTCCLPSNIHSFHRIHTLYSSYFLSPSSDFFATHVFIHPPNPLSSDRREDGYPVMSAKGALDKGWQELTWCLKVGRIRPSCKDRSFIMKKPFTKIPSSWHIAHDSTRHGLGIFAALQTRQYEN